MNVNDEIKTDFRSGLAVLVGRTNAGKSTLLNALAGRKISIVTPRPQTTRNPVQGVVHRPQGQIVFVDTPGFFKTHQSRLVDKLHERARRALDGIDVVVHVVDPTREPGDEDQMAGDLVRNVAQPRLLCLNKADARRRPFTDYWMARAGDYAAAITTSGLSRAGLDELADAIIARLPFGPPLYAADDVTNAGRDFIAAELIREQVYLQMGEEIPYRTRVEIDAWEERPDKEGRPMFAINATILAANPRYKAMLIGAGGKRIRALGVAARKELERQFGRKVFLDLEVLVDRKFVV